MVFIEIKVFCKRNARNSINNKLLNIVRAHFKDIDIRFYICRYVI